MSLGAETFLSGISTGTGANVFANSPTLITPHLGAAQGTSLTLSSPLAPSSGGTGLSSIGTANQVLTSNGSALTWSTPAAPAASVSSVALTVPSFLTVTGSPITSSGTLAISAASTGTGAVVLAVAPTMTGEVTVDAIVVKGTAFVDGSIYLHEGNDNNQVYYDSNKNGPILHGQNGGTLGWTTTGPAGFHPSIDWSPTLTTVTGDLSVSGRFLLANSELYQTGQWTPTAGEIAAPNTFTRLSSSEQYFYNDWTKIGNVVTVSMSLVFNCSAGTSGQGFCLMGLPFPAKAPITFLPSSTNNYTGTTNGILSLGIRSPGEAVALAGGTYTATGTEVIYYSGLGGTDAAAGTITSGETGLYIEFTATYLTTP